MPIQKELIQKLSKNELIVIAKRLNIDGYNRLKKEELISKIMQNSSPNKSEIIISITGGGEKKTKKINWLVYVPVGILIVGILSLLSKYSLQNKKEVCDSPQFKTFIDTTKYNIKIFDFETYSQCGGNIDCEKELITEIKKIVDEHSEVNIQIEKCTSSKYDLYTKKDAKRILQKSNSDLIIWGTTEANISTDSILVNLKYQTKTDTSFWLNFKESNDTIFSIRAILDIANKGIISTEIKDVIYWNLALKNSDEELIGSGSSKTKYFLSKISDNQNKEYSNVHHYAALVYLYDHKYEKALDRINKAFSLDSLSSKVLRDKALIHTCLSDIPSAIKSMKRSLILDFVVEDMPHNNSKNGKVNKLVKKSKDCTSYTMLIKQMFDFNFQINHINEVYQKAKSKNCDEPLVGLIEKEKLELLDIYQKFH